MSSVTPPGHRGTQSESPLGVNPLESQNPAISVQPVLPNPIYVTASPSDAPNLVFVGELKLLTSPENEQQAKIQTFAQRLFGYIKTGAAWGVSWTAETALFSSKEMKKIHDQSLQELRHLTGGADFGSFLSGISSLVSDAVKNGAVEDGFLKTCLQGEGEFLNYLIESMVAKVAVNIGRKVKEQRSQETGLIDPIISPMDITEYLTKALNERAVSLQQEMKIIDGIVDPGLRKKAQDEVFLRSSGNLLSTLFPEGSAELPLRIGVNVVFWSYLKNTLTPSLLRDTADSSIKFQQLSKTNALLEDSKQAPLANLSKACGDFVEGEANILSDVAVANSLADSFMRMIPSQGKEKDSSLKGWISSQIQLLGNLDDPRALALWKFLGGKVEIVASSMLSSLATSREQKPDDSLDISLGIALDMTQTVSDFVGKNRAIIEKTAKEIQDSGKDPKTNPRYIACFRPLAETLFKKANLGGIVAAMPDFLGKQLVTFYENKLPELLAAEYTTTLEPLAKLDAAITAPAPSAQIGELKKLPGGGFLALQGDYLKKRVSDVLPKYLVKKHEELSGKVVRSIIDTKPQLDAKIKQRIIGGKAEDKIPRKHVYEGEPTPKIDESNQWLRVWSDNVLLQLGSSKDLRIQNLWIFLEGTIDKLFAQSARHIHKQTPTTTNLSGDVINTVLGTFAEFMEEHGETVQNRYLELRRNKIVPESDQQFVDSLVPLCKEIYTRLGLDQTDESALPIILEPLLKMLVTEVLPDWIAGEYRQCLEPQECITRYKVILSELLNPGNPQEAAQTANQVEALCHVMAAKATASLENILYKRLEKGIGKKPEGFDLPVLQSFKTNYINQVLKSLIFQALVHYYQGLNADGSKAKGIPLTEAIAKIGNVLEKHLLADAKMVEEANSIGDADKRKEALIQAFSPLSHELLELLRSPTDTSAGTVPLIVPFPTLLEGVWADLKSQFLPEVLVETYLDKTSWPGILQRERAEIISRTKTTYVSETSKLLGKWVADFLPAYLYREREEIADKLYQTAAKSLASSGNPEGISVDEFLKQNEQEIKKRLAENVFSFFAPDSPLTAYAKPVTQDFIEIALTKLFNGITRKITEKEDPSHGQEEFLVNLGIRLLKVANEHFKTVNAAAGVNRASAAHKVSHHQFIEQFGEKLHKGVPQTAEALIARKEINEAMAVLKKERKYYSKIKDPQKKQKCGDTIKAAQIKLKNAKQVENKERAVFFKPLSDNLLEIAGITKAEDIPFPPPLRDELWNQATTKLLPDVLSGLFGVILEPATLNSMVISGLEQLNIALDAVPDPNLVEADVPKDETQRRLNKVCGELVLELVQLVPKSMIKAALKLERIQTLTSEKVGEAFRRQLGDNLSLLTILDKAARSGLPNLHPGKWVEKDGQLAFVGISPIAAPDSDGINFTFPLTAEEVEEGERLKSKKGDHEAVQMRKAMVATAHRVLAKSLSDFFKAPLIKFKILWDKSVDKVFGKYSQNIRDYFKSLGDRMVFRYIQIGLAMLAKYTGLKYLTNKISQSYSYAFWVFIDIYLGLKADHLIKSLHLEIHENLLYKLTDELIASLRNDRPMEQESIIEPLVRAALRRDTLEQREQNAYLRWLGFPG